MLHSGNVKTVIVDLDRTLLRTDKRLSDDTVSVLRACQQRGMKLMVATARPLRDTVQFCEKIDFDAITASNGARVVCGSMCAEYGIAPDTAKRLLNALQENPDLRITLETGDCAYSNKPIAEYETILSDDLAGLAETEAVVKILVHLDREETLAEVQRKLPEKLYATGGGAEKGFYVWKSKDLGKWSSGEKTLCFGCESGSKEDFLLAAKTLSNESKEFKKLLKTQLNEGVSFARAKVNALEQMELCVDLDLLKSPNNILGVEYTAAIIDSGADIEIAPVRRLGAGYSDHTLYEKLSSASAIRRAISEGKKSKIKSNLPKYVYDDLPDRLPSADDLTFYSLIMSDRKRLKGIIDCTEGLENRIKALLKDSPSLSALKEKTQTKRYTAARISRITTHSLLGISESFIRKCLRSDLYLNVLAVREGCEELLSEMRKNCIIPLITRKNDVASLTGTALECFEKDVLANDVYGFVTGKRTNEYMMLKI